ncbi:MAG: ABC transporter [Bacteroidetes bacterium HGW-Bacteroidetes-17]|jgi:putative ABC transport system permease protein|nr:MAG: ABC transporter [Bacteroidetes bacterium HGW-Bacteroidetes-17]
MILLRLIRESYMFAIQAIRVNKTRTFLSLMGITIGIFSIISVFTVFDSMEKSIHTTIDSLGDNVLFVQKMPWIMDGNSPFWKYFQRPEPKIDELEEIQRRSNTIQSAAFMTAVNRTLKYGSSSIENALIIAGSHDYEKVMSIDLQEGRYFTPIESAGGKPVVIIGSDIAEQLFGNTDPIGRTIKIFGRNIEVIGVFVKEGENIFGSSSDNQSLIPLNFIRTVIDLRSVSSNIIVKGRTNVSNEEMRDELTGIIRSLHKLKPAVEDDFAINETDMISKQFDSLFAVISVVGWIIGGFSLLVGGFGIANIMFVSVKERTSQIGIQKSLGAKNYFILLQFLFEAVFLSVLGGLAGLFIIFIITLLVNMQGLSFQLVLTLNNILLGIGVSGLIGLASGSIPAYNASKLNPVDAMRSTF